MSVDIHHGDCLAHLRSLEPESVDAIVTDPPYGLGSPPPILDVLRAWLAGEEYRARGAGFMGHSWDAFVPGPEVWRECLRVLKPGGHLLAFFGSRTVDVGGLAIRLAGFEIRDSLCWLYGTGFPKSLDVSKAIDRSAGAEREVIGKSARHVSGKPEQRTAGLCGTSTFSESIGMGAFVTAPATPEAEQWEGWGTALKPAHEPIVMARKPLRERTVAAQVLATGTGALNVDACRIAGDMSSGTWGARQDSSIGYGGTEVVGYRTVQHDSGRWPANVVLDEEAAEMLDAQSGQLAGRGNKGPSRRVHKSSQIYGIEQSNGDCGGRQTYDAGGGASRFFYCAKAGKAERGEGNGHPTVKPLALMRWLVRMVTPPGGIVLDPFAGSGTTLAAAQLEGFGAIGIEQSAEYVEIIRRRLATLDAAGQASLFG